MPIWSFCGLDNVLGLSVFRHDVGVTLVLSVMVRVALSDVDIPGTFYVQQVGPRPSGACQAYMSEGAFSFSVKKYTFYFEGI